MCVDQFTPYVATVFLTSSATLLPAAATVANGSATAATVSRPWLLSCVAQLHGPFNHIPEQYEHVELRLADDSRPLVALPTTAAKLLVHKLVSIWQAGTAAAAL